MSKRESRLLLMDMAEACEKIFQYTREMSYTDFKSDDRTSDAVIRNIEVIGEAANHLPDSFLFSHLEVSWQKAIAVRNRVIHEYFGVDYSILWKIVKEFLPDFYSSIQQLLVNH
jgi:uncharacterized protein with HEPN domain